MGAGLIPQSLYRSRVVEALFPPWNARIRPLDELTCLILIGCLFSCIDAFVNSRDRWLLGFETAGGGVYRGVGGGRLPSSPEPSLSFCFRVLLTCCPC